MINRIEDLVTAAKLKHNMPCVAAAAANDSNVIESINLAKEAGIIAGAWLIGPETDIRKIAADDGVGLGPFEVINEPDPLAAIEKSIKLLVDKKCDILMKGKVTTGDLMKKVLDKQYGFRTERAMSHIGVFTSPGENRIMLLTDAGINIAPGLSRKRDIILNAVDVAQCLGIERPKVAVLSFIETNDSTAQSVVDAIMLVNMNQNGEIPGCVVEGPYALDNAISPESARIKKLKGEVAGRADILVAHDINVGNALYKALGIWSKAVLAAVVAGSKIPIVVPSRADSKETKLHSIALASLLVK
ncbi:MAG: hypothetical protein A2297_03515 [Elusimicrobia bacterium RIFOXYB2_FULL_48_7]|nr:MAG: hypothetical protein A2297_03515 [Elusimicrobia bacterium RIFOXYB2_FULL_48_7]